MVLERTYIIPLRKEWLKAPKYKRSKKAIKAIKEFLARHMKSDNVKILNELNLEVWKHGIKNPPCKVKISTVKDDEGVVRANLFGKSTEGEKKVEEKPKPASKLAQAVEKMKGKSTPSPKKIKKAKKEAELEKKIKVTEVPKETEAKKVETKKEVKTEAKETKPAEVKKDVSKPEVKEIKPKVEKEVSKTETKPELKKEK